jgi:TgpA N-terminal domain/Transglutaminase-like superfamily
MSYRLTVTTAAAVILASVSLYPLLDGIGWFWAGAGAVIVAAAAGLATRLPALPACAIATILTLAAVAPLLVSPAWYLELTGVVVVICVAGSVTRLRLLPTVAGACTYLASLLVYVNLLFAGPESTAGIVPTSASLRQLVTLANRGIGERIYAPPVPGTPGAVLLAAAGIGLMAAAADLIAVRLRSPAMAGLPLLALFSVPITTSARQGAAGATVAFCLGVTGYLAVLAADGRERLRIWGRLVTLWQSGRDDDDEPGRGPDTRALAASGRRLGLAAVSLAIFIPLLLPGLRVHKLFSGHGSAGGSGTTQIPLPDPVVRLQHLLHRGGNATVLTYTTNDVDAQQQYLQVYVLNYDGGANAWRLQPPVPGIQVGNMPLPPAPGLSGFTHEQSSTTRITMSRGAAGYGSKLNFLPLPYVPQTVRVPGNWQVDLATLMVFSAQSGLSGLAYTVRGEDVEPSVQQLDHAGAPLSGVTRQYSSFSSPAGSTLRALAKKISADAGAKTSYQKAIALEKWFTSGNFTYNVRAGQPDTPAGLVNFLTKTRQGFCQQFAFGMAALARLDGIPSRVAVGYTAGTRQPDGKTWKVTTADAHAWPELYFQGAGWLRFEPTPGGVNGQGTAVQPAYAQAVSPAGPGTAQPQPVPASSAGAPLGTKNRSGLKGKLSHLPGQGGHAAARHGNSVPVAPIAIGILALAAAAPRTARTIARRRRWHAARDDGALAHAAWLELHDDLTDYGIGWRVSESPRAVSRRLASTLRLDAATRQALDRVARAEERARYAKVAQAAQSLRADVTAIRRAVAAGTGRAARWRARLLPPSALAPMRSGLQQALDVFGWLDAAGLRIRGRVRQLGREN